MIIKPISLPPLNSLKAFESAGRHMSFTDAAKELHVTPAAISHQIKALESYLGIKLFYRKNRSLELTLAGRTCLPGLRKGFEHLIKSVERIQSHTLVEPLVISAPPIFGARWLVPKIADFSIAHPDIQIRIDPLQRITALDGPETDVAIRFGRGRYPGLRAHMLMKQDVFPVCSPKLAQSKYPLDSPEDLKQHTLIHFDPNFYDPDWPQWEQWFRAANIKDIDASFGPRFSSPNFTLQAVLQGQGVSLAVSLMADDLISQGKLVRLFDVAYPGDYGYYTVMSDEKAEEPNVEAFWQWLTMESISSNSNSAVE